MQIVDVVFGIALLVAVVFLSQYIWKREALRHAAHWAIENYLVLVAAESSSLRMHTTRARILITTKSSEGKLYRCDLALRRANLFAGRNWRTAELIEKYEIEQQQAA